jgi:hypothetical protein
VFADQFFMPNSAVKTGGFWVGFSVPRKILVEKYIKFASHIRHTTFC